MTNTKEKFFTDTRITGLLYLALAITGMFVFLVAKSNLYVAGDAASTNTNLLEKETLARFGIVGELLLVASQALVAMWFYKIFKKVNSFAAVVLATFGMVNAVLILISSGAWLAALNAAVLGEPASTAFTLYNLHETIWLVGGLFFGLWLIPMGYLAAQANISRILAGFLIVGGGGYILSTFVVVFFPTQASLAGIMTMPATIGEFWMLGYLLRTPHLHGVNSELH